jgi:hypothetical protein
MTTKHHPLHLVLTLAVLTAAFALPAAADRQPTRKAARQSRATAPAEATIQRPEQGGVAGGGGHEGPGGLETPGGSRDYGLLKQTQTPHDPHPWGYVLAELKADKGEVLDEPWDPSWEYEVKTTDNELRNQLTLVWYAQAACAGGLAKVQVTGPGGVKNQPLAPGQPTVHGKFSYQSFTIATIKKICVDWAEQTPPGWPGAPMVAQYEEWDLVGGNPPTTFSDQLTLNWQCQGGLPMSSLYQPKIHLRCSRQGS